MAGKKKKSGQELLTDLIVKGIQEKKGRRITSLDFRNISGNSVCGCFVVCHATSGVHAAAIAGSVEDRVKAAAGIQPWHKEGERNAEWILLDYIDVVVHVFQEKTRDFYKLESLWADAEITEFDSD